MLLDEIKGEVLSLFACVWVRSMHGNAEQVTVKSGQYTHAVLSSAPWVSVLNDAVSAGEKNPRAFKWICSPLNQAPSWSYLLVFSTNGYQCKLAQTFLPFGLLKYFLLSEVQFFVVYSVFFEGHTFILAVRGVWWNYIDYRNCPFCTQAFIKIKVR
jgi:hypothetical protein